jgi:hypothetical protein
LDEFVARNRAAACESNGFATYCCAAEKETE